MSSQKRFFRLALLATLMALFAVPPQVVRGQETTEVKRKVKSQVNPSYPDLARRMNVRGKVRVEVTVAPDGTVKNVKLLGGHPLLASVSQEAVRNWKFEPGPKETTQIVEFNFE